MRKLKFTLKNLGELILGDRTFQESLILGLNDKLIDSANFFFRTLVLINGGLSIAALGFATNLGKATDKPVEVILKLSDAVFLGAVGVAFASAAIFFGYFTNNFLGKIYIRPDDKGADFLHSKFFALTIISSLLSLGCFVWSCYGLKVALGG